MFYIINIIWLILKKYAQYLAQKQIYYFYCPKKWKDLVKTLLRYSCHINVSKYYLVRLGVNAAESFETCDISFVNYAVFQFSSINLIEYVCNLTWCNFGIFNTCMLSNDHHTGLYENYQSGNESHVSLYFMGQN